MYGGATTHSMCLHYHIATCLSRAASFRAIWRQLLASNDRIDRMRSYRPEGSYRDYAMSYVRCDNLSIARPGDHYKNLHHRRSSNLLISLLWPTEQFARH